MDTIKKGKYLKLFRGYDNRGKVYQKDDKVLRFVNSKFKKSVLEVFDVYKSNSVSKIGIVDTHIRCKNPALVLEHPKYITSYPYEWTPNMFKDSILFYLKLLFEIDRYGLTLKDALPNNILFNFYQPIFVDFFSLIMKRELQNELWLTGKNRDLDPKLSIIDRMFIPFNLIPLIAMARGNYKESKELLFEKSCNAGNGSPVWQNIFPIFGQNGILVEMLIEDAINGFGVKMRGDVNYKRLWKLIRMPIIKGTIPVDMRGFVDFVRDTRVTPAASNYLTYYDDKQEDLNFSDMHKWKNKQKNVYRIIRRMKPNRVLDLGANTGWFSRLAEKLGAEVIAVDIDVASMDHLYEQVKKDKLKILPLTMSFNDLCVKAGERTNYLFMSPTDRFKSDLVLCLGLLHHLILGMGNDLDYTLKIMAKLTKKVLIVEFVDLRDEKILLEPSFFANLKKYNYKNYNLDLVVKKGMKFFRHAEILNSNPDTRKLIIFTR